MKKIFLMMLMAVSAHASINNLPSNSVSLMSAVDTAQTIIFVPTTTPVPSGAYGASIISGNVPYNSGLDQYIEPIWVSSGNNNAITIIRGTRATANPQGTWTVYSQQKGLIVGHTIRTLPRLLYYAGTATPTFTVTATPTATCTQTNTFTSTPTNTPTVPTSTPTATNTMSVADYLPHLRFSYENMNYGYGRCQIAWIGDSTTMGHGAPVTDWITNAKIWSMPSQVAAMLSLVGIPAKDDSFISHNGTVSLQADMLYDPRLTYGAGWDWGGQPSCLGGNLILNNTTTNAFSFASAVSVTSFEVDYAVSGAAASLSVQIDSGTPVTYAVATTPNGIAAVTISTSEGVHTINVKRVSSGQIYISSILAYNTVHPFIEILNAGVNGAQVSSFADAGSNWAPASTLGTFWKPACTFIDLEINDQAQGTNLTTYQTYMQTIITSAKLGGGDVVLMTSHPINGYPNNPLDYIGVIKSLAVSNGCLLVDTYGRYKTWANANALGFMWNGAHMNKFGYRDKATLVADVINQAIR
jgi:hypothetical protein